MSSIYDVPAVAKAMRVWRESVSPECPHGDRDLHNSFVAAVKAEQIRRGQRSRMSYGRGA